jgi:hypothetical protein
MQNNNEQAEIARECQRIGIQPEQPVPLPRFVKSGADYLALLKRVPDGSGIPGFIETMKQGKLA